MKRWFSPSSARRALRFVRPAVENIRLLYRELERSAPSRVVTDGPVSAEYYRRLRHLDAWLEALHAAGVCVRDPCRGQIEFPARRAGRPVWLCWCPGDRTLAWWHDGGGFSRRRVLDEAGPWDPDPGDRLADPYRDDVP
jgi:hypothetical protein